MFREMMRKKTATHTIENRVTGSFFWQLYAMIYNKDYITKISCVGREK